MRVVCVTGTSTGVGKTVVTAVLARVALDHGLRVGVVKPVQTGVAGQEPTDMATVGELSGCRDTMELVGLDEPLAPDTAARLHGLTLPMMGQQAEATVAFASARDVVLVEGAGGIAVRLDTEGGTLVTLADAVRGLGHHVEFVVVTSLALGTLNHTELTVQALVTSGQSVAGLAIGALPPQAASLGNGGPRPGQSLAEEVNLTELQRVTGLPVLARIPSGVGVWSPVRFRSHCGDWVSDHALRTLGVQR